jgi:hypothetical protein
MPNNVDWNTDYSEDDDVSDEESDTDDEEISDETFPVYDLEYYAANNFIKHLTHTQKSTLSSEEEQLIMRALPDLFLNPDSLKHSIDGSSNLALLATEWMSGPNYVEFVRGWFWDQRMNNNHYTESEVEKLKKISYSDQELLKGLAVECAKYWLEVADEYDNVQGYVSFLNTYVPMVSRYFPLDLQYNVML